MREILTAVEAAKILQIRPQAVREHMKNGVYPFNCIGTVVKGKANNQYLVYARKLIEHFGIPEDTVERRLNG